jgi:hypothetical protein
MKLWSGGAARESHEETNSIAPCPLPLARYRLPVTRPPGYIRKRRNLKTPGRAPPHTPYPIPKMTRPLLAIALGTLMCAAPLKAQLTIGVGGGAGVGTRGGSESAAHGLGFVEFKLPVFPGIRGDVIAMDAPAGSGPLTLALSGVMSLPIPIVKPYVMAGWGKYGVGKGESESGWHFGAGVRVSVMKLGVFAEGRRQKFGRDLLTVGITF